MSTDPRIEDAIGSLRALVARGGNAHELAYLDHEPRYRRTLARVLELAPPGAAILDVGSHYLHLAVMLRELGYRVIGLDVPEFVEPMRARAKQFDIQNHADSQVQLGEFLAGREASLDFVLFCEIQEHITFNPVRFWQRIYELLRVSGVIYLTTPNSMSAWQALSNIKRSLLLQGSGLPVDAIVSGVTYGCRWKEYSASELRELFALLSPDFDVRVQFYNLREPEPWTDPKSAMRALVHRVAARVPSLRDELEAVITLTGHTRWLARPPAYI